MAGEFIGNCRCPVCSSPKARLTLAKTQLVLVTCNGCNFQGFARSGVSDEKLRERLVTNEPPAPPLPPEPVRTAAPTNVRTEQPAPAPTPEPEPAEADSMRWGAFPWLK